MRTATRQDTAGFDAITVEGREYPDYPGIAEWYADLAATGSIPVCKWTRLTAERFLRMRERAESGKADYWWSPEHIVDVCSFQEKLPHVEAFTGALTLEPWQIFSDAAIWGFRRHSDGGRLVTRVSEYVPRKHGKSLRTAMRAHFVMTCEGEPGPLGFIGAATKDQASKVFDPMKKLAERSPALREHFGITATLDEIRYGCNGGVVYRMTSKAESQDGHNPHLVIMEELHAQDAGLIEVMQSALGGRSNPLLLSISTAGRTAMGIGWENWRWIQRILEGEVARDRAEHVFGLIYTIDEDDEERLHEEEVIRKANPGYPVAPRREAVKQELTDSQATPGALAEFKRTRFNIWSRAANALLRQDDWARCADKYLTRDEYLGKPGFAGADLASRNDLAATCLLFEDGPTIAAFWRYYICEGAPVFEQSPELATLYLSWADAGWLRITPGAYIDFNLIRDDLIADLERHGITRVGVDDWQANQFIADLQAEGYEPVAVKKTARNITEPTDEILARVKDQTFIHDGNPISEWCATNVVAFRDENDNILPKRDKTKPLDKIDGFDALVNANAVRLTYREERQVSVYERRGLLGADEEEKRA